MLFNIIWDFCPDMMHTIKTFFDRLVIGVYSGSRQPSFCMAAPKPLAQDATARVKRTHAEKTKTYDVQKRMFALTVRTFQECKFSKADQTTVDERVKNLVGYPD